jgi:hypothetical protein
MTILHINSNLQTVFKPEECAFKAVLHFVSLAYGHQR